MNSAHIRDGLIALAGAALMIAAAVTGHDGLGIIGFFAFGYVVFF